MEIIRMSQITKSVHSDIHLVNLSNMDFSPFNNILNIDICMMGLVRYKYSVPIRIKHSRKYDTENICCIFSKDK